MPISYLTSTDLDLVYARWVGDVSLDDIFENFERYLADVHYRAGRPELIDTSGIREIDLDFNRARALLRLVNAQQPGEIVRTRTVIWAPGDTVFGLARMYQQIAEMAGGIEVEVYREEAEALAALGLPVGCVADLLDAGGFQPAMPILRVDGPGSA